MLSIPRFARIFLLALVLVTVPTAFLFYPSSNSSPAKEDGVSLDKGGIDSEHWREPVSPPQGMREEIEDEGERGMSDAGGFQKAVEEEEEDEEEEGNVAGDTGSPREKEGTKGEHEGGRMGGVLLTTDEGGKESSGGRFTVPQDVLSGAVIMPHLGNATAKAELGRAAWRVLHLMTMRYPEKPTEDDRAALKSFFYLFGRLYPCGECAEHFQKMLKKYPPQTSSRKSASLWLCSVHNVVNERLRKPQFDCLTLDATYDCGCANETSTAAGATATATSHLLDSAAE